MFMDESVSRDTVKIEEKPTTDIVDSLISWWHEHANLCIVAATIPPTDTDAHTCILRQLDESMVRGEVMLRTVLLETQTVRRSVSVLRENDPYRAFPNASSLMPASGMNRFEDPIMGSAKLTRPLTTIENPVKELQPSRNYLKKNT